MKLPANDCSELPHYDRSVMNGKSKFLLFTILAFLVMQTSAAADANPLSEFRWKNRPLLVFAADADDPDAQQTRRALGASACELRDRDMVIGWILERGEGRLGEAFLDAMSADALRSRLRIRQGEFAAVLIGKDGGVKARYAKAPDLEEVFALIDGMPMRRSEMRQRGPNCNPVDGD